MYQPPYFAQLSANVLLNLGFQAKQHFYISSKVKNFKSKG